MTPEPTVCVSTRVKQDVHERLQAISKANYRSVAQTLQLAIDAYLGSGPMIEATHRPAVPAPEPVSTADPKPRNGRPAKTQAPKRQAGRKGKSADGLPRFGDVND